MISYVKGDVFQAPAVLIAHGVNCRGGFGKGVAGQISSKYPQVRESYLKKYKANGWSLGDIQLVRVNDTRWFANCATQDNYWNPGNPRQIYADYGAITVCMKKLSEVLIEHAGWKLAMPKIGAGLAGGDWVKIEAIINNVFPTESVTVYTLD